MKVSPPFLFVALPLLAALGCHEGGLALSEVKPHEASTFQESSTDTAPSCCCAKQEETPSCCANREETADCCAVDQESAAEQCGQVTDASTLSFPDVELLDQDGKKVRFYTDLVKDQVVAMNFFFTTCKTICPPLTANFASLQKKMIENGYEGEFRMISISVDPVNDTPPRLKAWGEQFGAQPGWTFLTGDKRTVDSLLKALRAFTPLKEDHSPIVLIGNEAQAEWTRVYGLGAPEEMANVLAKTIEKRRELTAKTKGNEAARNYFTDTPLVNQHGETKRLYSDLIQGKTVIINCFFSECVGVCPVLNKNLNAIQEALGDRLGEEALILSISVDSEKDTPQRLAEYAKLNNAGAGWHLLTGDKENVELALRKLGLYVERRESHSSVFLIGNDRTGLWKKAFGLADIQKLIPIVEEVDHDSGSQG